MSRTAIKERKPARKPRANISIRPERMTGGAAPAAPAPPPAESPAPVEAIGPICVHRWVIESPNGETSHGVCRHCGAEKDFPNAAEDGLWERNVPQSRWTGRSEWKPTESGY